MTDRSDPPIPDPRWSARDLILLGIGVLILLPTLSMPLGQDQATFFRGGRSMLEGGLLYVDFIDVKPPLLFLIYGVGGTLFGSTEFAIRLFDLLWQAATLTVLLMVLKRAGLDRVWVTISVLLYAVLYTTLGHAPTAQAETVFALPLLGTLVLLDRPSTWKRDVLLGVLTGIAFLLKYPLAIIGPAAVLLFWLRGDGARAALVALIRIGGASFLTIGLLTLPLLLDPRFLPALGEMAEYLRVYAGKTPWSLSTITLGLKSTAQFFGDNISVIVCVALVLGLLNARRPISWTSAFLFLALAFTVAVERKFAPYHFARLYIPLVILAGGGGVMLIDLFKHRWTVAVRWQRWTLVGALVIAVAFSPLPRLGNTARLAAASLGDPSAYDAYLTRPELPGFDYTAIETLRLDLEQRLTPNDRLMMISLMATPIVPFLPTDHVGIFADAHFYHGVGARESWKRQAVEQMRRSTIVVVDTIDQCTGMTLHPYTSWEAIQREPALWTELQTNFHCVDTVASFYLFEPNP